MLNFLLNFVGWMKVKLKDEGLLCAFQQYVTICIFAFQLDGQAKDSSPTAAIKKRLWVRRSALSSVILPVGIPPTDMAGLE